MFHNPLIQDRFGRRYKLHLLSEEPSPKHLEPKLFSDEIFTRNFLHSLNLSGAYWRELSHQLAISSSYTANPQDALNSTLDSIARLLIQGRIKIFEIDKLDAKQNPIEKRTFKQADGRTYQFITPTDQLLNPNKRAKAFNSKEEAVEFVRALSLEEESIHDLAQAFNLSFSVNTQNKDQGVLYASLANMIFDEKVLVVSEALGKPTAQTTQEPEHESMYIEGTSSRPETTSQDKAPARIDSTPHTNPEYQCKVLVTTQTRAGSIPLKGLHVLLNDIAIGVTESNGKAPESALINSAELTIKVTYANDEENLKKETFEIKLTEISAESMSYAVGQAKNAIPKIQDVMGTGSAALSGDKDFNNSYDYDAGLISMVETDDPYIRRLNLSVLMATLSLDLPYLSQRGTSETIITSTPTPANPTGTTQTYSGNIICMPTSVKMMMDYWDIKDSENNDISRNKLMQDCWDDSDNPSANFPRPWQCTTR